jgi:hypothetical protein
MMVSSSKKWSVSIFTSVVLSLLIFGMFGGLPQAGAMQTPVWSDTFSDGNIDDWNVFGGSFSATTLRMESGTDLWNYASHPSAVAEGEWQFTVCVDATAGASVAFMATTTSGVGISCPSTCYAITFSPYDGWIRLYKHDSGRSNLGSYTVTIVLGTVFDVIVTRDSSGHFNVWIGDTLQISADSTDITSSSYFVVRFCEGGYIDNIRVYDEIIHTTTNGGDGDNDGNGGGGVTPLPIEVIALAGGLVAIIVIVVVFVLRRRKLES